MKHFFAWTLTLALLAACMTGCTSTETIKDAESTDTTPPAVEESTEETTAGDSAADTEQDPAEAEEVPDIAVADEMEITLYLPDDQAESFEEVTETVDATPQGIVDALISHGALPEGVKVNSFSMSDNGVETQEGDTVSYTAGDTLRIDLDLSKEFAEAASSTGTSGELMLLGSLVNTMLKAYNADEITITCDGAPLETGHNVYDQPLTFYDLP